MLVSFSGLAGSGKDTAAAFLVGQHNFRRFAFADKLKEICSRVFNIPSVYLHSNMRDQVLDTPIVLTRDHCFYIIREVLKFCAPDTDEWAVIYDLFPGTEFTSYRQLLQIVGTDILRDHFSKDVWLVPLIQEVEAGGKIVVSDARFQNEVDLVHDLGGTSYEIVRPGTVQMNHISEVVPTTSRIIINDSSIRELTTKLNREIIDLTREETAKFYAFDLGV